ncbi:MAG TPA: SprT family zinc-dependent metalloprotease [Thermoanaerobaculia bacterium]|nr:SprT family zinc-dependent metalloprotease [Thermoanaerobaculia bacterium]
MASRIKLGDMVVDVVLKDIKNVHLSVYPPDGAVRISAPKRMSLDTIRLFAISRLTWIRQQQKKLREQEREAPRDYVERESHYVWGKRYLLELREVEAPPCVELRHKRLVLNVRPGTSPAARESVVEEWYRQQLKAAVAPLLARWESLLGVSTRRFFVQRMKTKWGSCNQYQRTIRLNSELAKKPPECLEYLVVHELAHLIEPTHNARFIALMDRFLPQWRLRRELLNRLPVRQETWSY